MQKVSSRISWRITRREEDADEDAAVISLSFPTFSPAQAGITQQFRIALDSWSLA